MIFHLLEKRAALDRSGKKLADTAARWPQLMRRERPDGRRVRGFVAAGPQKSRDSIGDWGHLDVGVPSSGGMSGELWQ